jgi:aromatic ring hydroxylase
MEKETIAELDTVIRKAILAMKKVEVFDSHSILNFIYFNNRPLFDKMENEDKPRTPEQWIAFRRRVYSRINNSSGDLIDAVEKKQSWSVLYDGSFGPCTYWRRLTKAERGTAKASIRTTAPKRSTRDRPIQKKSNTPSVSKGPRKSKR